MKNIRIIILILLALPPFLSDALRAQDDSAIREIEELLENKKFLEFNKDDWKKVREEKEQGTFKVKEEVTMPVKGEGAGKGEGVTAPAAAKGTIDVILPYESELSISGRQDIKFQLGYNKYPNREEYIDSITPDMEQKTQVKIKGTVAKRVQVDVDYDNTSENKQDISIVYKGEPGDVIQEAAFGDVTMSLPGSEFVSYMGSKKSLLGGKLSGQYEKLKFMVIGSQDKGVPEVKKFTGNTSFKKIEINDNSYTRRKYYKIYISTAHLPVSDETIYIDDKNTSNNDVLAGIDEYKTVELSQGTTYYGFFNRQIPGKDYYINYREGIITFKKAIESKYIIAVSYKYSGGDVGYGSGKPTVIKIDNESAWNANELKNYYNIGETRLFRGVEGRDFIVKIQDLNRNDVSTASVSNIYQQLEMDYEAGILKFRDEKFFNTYFGQPDVYYQNNTLSLYHHYTIYIEYSFRKKSYLLRFNILEGSERVLLNNKLLVKDKDYKIEYISGYITFVNENEITPESQIEISYEYAPWEGQVKKTLLGLWGQYDFSNRFSVKSTLISDGAPSPLSVPDLGAIPSATRIFDINTSLNLDSPKLPLKTNISAEYARSSSNPNVFGKAMVDNMEGIKLSDSMSVNENSWRIARNPDGSAVNAKSKITWNSEDESEYLVEINTNVATMNRSDRVQVLKVDYNMTSITEQASMAYVISQAGVDFTKKVNLECYIYNDGNPKKLIFRLGNIEEDADKDSQLDTEDVGLDGEKAGPGRLADVGENDGLLSENEDTGWYFDLWHDSYNVIDRLDTEDLDNDGILDPDLSDGGVVVSSVNWSLGWQKVSYDLNVSSATDWSNIKHLRITVTGADQPGYLKIAELKITGNKWEKGVVLSTGTLTVDIVNNEENPDIYKPLSEDATKINIDGSDREIKWYYDRLYPDYSMLANQIRKEQALSLKYENLVSGATAYTLSKMSQGDFAGHDSIRLFVYAKSTSTHAGTYFIQFGSEKSYCEYKVSLNWSGWKMLELYMVDTDSDNVPNKFEVKEGSLSIVGTPSFLSIAQIKTGIYNYTAGAINGEVWVNEIHLNGARKKVGSAWRITGNTSIPNWFSLSGSVMSKNMNFETITAPSTLQDITNTTVSGRFDRLKFMPIFGNFNKSEITTPKKAFIPGDVETYTSSYQMGKVKSTSMGGGTSFIVNKLPNLNYNYGENETRYYDTGRFQKSENHTLTGTYRVPVRFFPVPLFKLNKTINLLPESLNYSYNLVKSQTSEDLLNLKESQRNISLSTRLAVLKKLPIDGAYSFNTSNETKGIRLQEDNVSVGTTIGLLSWLQLVGKYSRGNKEDYNILSGDSPTIHKDISRTSSAEIGLPLRAASIVKAMPILNKIKLLSNIASDFSFSGRYRWDDGDIYNEVDKDYQVLQKFDDVPIPEFIPIRKGNLISLLTGDSEHRDINIAESGGRLKSYNMQDTVNCDLSWTPLSFMKLGKAFSFLTDTRTRGSFGLVKNNSQMENSASKTDNLTYNVDVIVSNIDKSPMIRFLPVIGRNISAMQGTYSWNSRQSNVIGMSISSTTVNSIDTRFKLFIFDLWVKYVNTQNLTMQSGVTANEGNNDQLSGNINFRVFGNTQFVVKASKSINQQWAGVKDSANLKTDDLSANIGVDMNTSIEPSKFGVNVPGSARISGTLLNWLHNDSSLDERKANDTFSIMTMTVEYDQGNNFLLSFGGGGKIFNPKDADDKDKYWTVDLWVKLTFQF